MFVNVKENEIGLVFKNGIFIKVIQKGSHLCPQLLGYNVELEDLTGSYSNPLSINIFLKNPDFASIVEIVEVSEKEIVIHKQDGVIKEVLKAGKYYFYKTIIKHEFIRVDTTQYEMGAEFDESILTNPILTPFYVEYFVYEYQFGLLFVNGKFIRKLSPGRYRFWNQTTTINVTLLEKRIQQIEIQGQELLTQDRISLRLNFTCQYQITNPEKVILEVQNYTDQLHILMQLVLRDFVSSWKLDSLLEKKEEAASVILNRLKEKEKSFGVEFHNAGIKDVILPGEMKDILNTVVIAEKKAQANIIMRREETASTRSLLNTAKLMEENPTLFRLKELEYLEKILEKMGTVNVNTNSPLLDQFAALFGKQ
ncbi:MAG: slipin family protein [Leptospiraceae bacterium]|nr:slipin family protein [Leptospiraceae bacterium]MCP5495933.1 slipin family protein [Leptospiraceae bacterium]